MNLGINKVINDGNGNTILYTALIAAAIANSLPTPMDSVYFRRVNTLRKDFEEGKISAEKLNWHIAGEYYLWTSMWYVMLFLGIYSFGGKYSNNAKIILALLAGGLVVGAVNRNIEIDKQTKKDKVLI